MRSILLIIYFLCVNSFVFCQADTILFNTDKWEWFIEPNCDWVSVNEAGTIVYKRNSVMHSVLSNGAHFLDFNGLFLDNSIACARSAENMKCGFIDKEGNWVVAPKFDELNVLIEGYARAKLNGKWGFVDTVGNWKILPQYDTVLYFKENIAAVRQNGKWGFIDKDNKTIVPFQFESISTDFSNNNYLVEKHGVSLRLNLKGEFITENIEEKWSLTDNLIRVFENGKYGIQNTSGEWIVQPIFEETDLHFYRGLLLVKLNDKYGYINRSGDYVIEPQYYYANSFSTEFPETSYRKESERNGVSLEEAFFYNLPYDHESYFRIDTCNNKYAEITTIIEDSIYAAKTVANERFMFIDKNYLPITDTVFEDLVFNGYFDRKIKVKTGTKWKLLNLDLSPFCSIEMDTILEIYSELFIYKNNDTYGYITKNGQNITTDFDCILAFKRGFAAVQQNEKWGFINQNGDLVIPIVYDSVATFSNGLAAVKQGNLWGYIDESGTEVIKPKFEKQGWFSTDYAIVNEKNKYGLINMHGDFEFFPHFDFIGVQRNTDFVVVKLNGKSGIIRKKKL